MSGCTELPGKNDVSVEDCPDSVANWLVEIVAFHQHREKAGDGTSAKAAGALEDLGEQVEDRRRISFLTGRLTGGESNLALCHGEPGDGVHHQ